MKQNKMSTALVVNCSRRYNLGADKLAHWLRDEGWGVSTYQGDPGMFALGFDLVCLSVMFSWDAQIAREIALRVKAHSEIWAGGPGLFALGSWWQRQTGIPPAVGLDHRFELQRGDYAMTFASRGCPVGCWFCIVPQLEGVAFTLDWDFEPTEILADNNLSALPDDFQDHIVKRYQDSGVVLRDAQSGFEPRTFTEDVYRRWQPILRGPWRFAFDEMAEAEDVHATMQILRGERRKRIRTYVLIGNEPMNVCYERAWKVLEWGGEPFCQPFIPLNSLDGIPSVRHDWTVQRLKDFARYFNRFLWKYVAIQDYRHRVDGPPPFLGVLRDPVIGR